MIAYKATEKFKCLNQTYRVGKTYTSDKMKMCKYGIHFCKDMRDTLNYYAFNPSFVLLEIEVLGQTEFKSDKGVTDKIKVLRVVPKEEYTEEFKKLLLDCEYDEKGRMISLVSYSGVKHIYEWDERNNLISHTFPKRGVNVNEWDGKNRIISRTHTYDNGIIAKVFYEYDERDNVIRRTRDDGKFSLYEYDEHNNMISDTDHGGIKYYYPKAETIITESDS